MTVTLSPKFQIVIPKEMREDLKLKKGMKIELIPLKGNIILVPVKRLEDMMGTLKGMDTSNIREKTDRNI
ncbi:AbrB/MazE/SpoVT family DNA-binding domain-containing protein [Patescibacteria group bacterium]|nr:AbrB/MazE/SpoVT family DNA-binding domain-containing protein [Patescibacteria group bacterium]